MLVVIVLSLEIQTDWNLNLINKKLLGYDSRNSGMYLSGMLCSIVSVCELGVLLWW